MSAPQEPTSLPLLKTGESALVSSLKIREEWLIQQICSYRRLVKRLQFSLTFVVATATFLAGILLRNLL